MDWIKPGNESFVDRWAATYGTRFSANTPSPCSNCNGSGGIQIRDENGNVIAEVVCPACGGTGQSR